MSHNIKTNKKKMGKDIYGMYHKIITNKSINNNTAV